MRHGGAACLFVCVQDTLCLSYFKRHHHLSTAHDTGLLSLRKSMLEGGEQRVLRSKAIRKYSMCQQHRWHRGVLLVLKFLKGVCESTEQRKALAANVQYWSSKSSHIFHQVEGCR